MKKVAVLSIAVVLLVPQLFAAGAESMKIDALTLTLGMSDDALASRLPAGWNLAWQRDTLPQPTQATKTDTGVRYKSKVVVDGKPVTINYDDDHGAHGYVTNAAGEPVVMLVFERGKLTRATRLLATSQERSATSPELVSTLAGALDTWNRDQKRPVTVRTTREAGLEEVVFAAGSRQLIILSTEAGTQIVENLGRGDIAAVTVE